MAPIRVMLVDDAVVVRHVLSDALSAEADIEVVGTAADGVIAMQKLPGLNPDVVVLDVEMPNKDGIETLADIKRDFPKVRVIMFSTLTANGAAATMDAMLLGADDYTTKPSNTGSMAGAVDVIKSELIPKIRALAGSRQTTLVTPRPATNGAIRFGTAQPSLRTPVIAPVKPAVAAPVVMPPPVAQTPAARVPRVGGSPKILAVAVSTGGPNALAEFLPSLPANFPVPVVITQHIPRLFSKALADRLDGKCALKVVEGEEGMVVEAGNVYIAPGDFHMTLHREGTEVRIALNQGPTENSCRPAADVMFRSVVDTYGSSVLGLVMTGMGYDGLKGAQNIVEHGGNVIAQDEASSVVWGMPGAVVEKGVASGAFPLDQLGRECVTRTQLSHATH